MHAFCCLFLLGEGSVITHACILLFIFLLLFNSLTEDSWPYFDIIFMFVFISYFLILYVIFPFSCLLFYSKLNVLFSDRGNCVITLIFMRNGDFALVFPTFMILPPFYENEEIVNATPLTTFNGVK